MQTITALSDWPHRRVAEVLFSQTASSAAEKHQKRPLSMQDGDPPVPLSVVLTSAIQAPTTMLPLRAVIAALAPRISCPSPICMYNLLPICRGLSLPHGADGPQRSGLARLFELMVPSLSRNRPCPPLRYAMRCTCRSLIRR